MENIIKQNILATFLLLGISVLTDASADVYKCVTGGHVTYSTVASDCSTAKKTETLATPPADKYHLDLGERHEMGAAAHSFLSDRSTTIPHYS